MFVIVSTNILNTTPDYDGLLTAFTKLRAHFAHVGFYP